MKRDLISDGLAMNTGLSRDISIQSVSVDVRGAAVSRILDDVSLQMNAGSLTALVGPSGAGKTTLLRVLAGLVQPSGGIVAADGEVWCDASRKIFRAVEGRNLGMVFQTYALWPHLSVGENIAFPLRVRRLPKTLIDAKVGAALEMVRLNKGKGAAMPSQVSGGEQQRVGLARALVYEPSVLLLDEPLANLDAVSRDQIRDEIRLLQQRLGITAVYVTHDQNEALAIADNVVLMAQGKIVEAAPPREIHGKPKTRFGARFFGAKIELAGRFNAQSSAMEFGAGVSIRLSDVAMAESQAALLLLRPADIALSEPGPGGSAWRGRVAAVLFTGERTRCTVETSLGEIQVDLPSAEHPAVGQPVQLEVKAGAGRVFPAHGLLAPAAEAVCA